MLFLMEAFFAVTAVCAVNLAPMPAFVAFLFMALTFGIFVFILVQTFRK